MHRFIWVIEWFNEDVNAWVPTADVELTKAAADRVVQNRRVGRFRVRKYRSVD